MYGFEDATFYGVRHGSIAWLSSCGSWVGYFGGVEVEA